jgi:hypothetical protein
MRILNSAKTLKCNTANHNKTKELYKMPFQKTESITAEKARPTMRCFQSILNNIKGKKKTGDKENLLKNLFAFFILFRRL